MKTIRERDVHRDDLKEMTEIKKQFEKKTNFDMKT
jgi:hypothetical protein